MSNTLRQRLTPMDAFFLYLETHEQPMHVGSVCIFEGRVSYAKFLKHLQSRLGLVPRYRQRLITVPLHLGHPLWEDDPNFKITNHVFRVRLSEPGTEEQLRQLAGEIMTGVLDRNKPLWEVYLVDGLEGDRSALIFKVHHAMVDGVAGVSLAMVLFDLDPNPPASAVPPVKPKKKSLPDAKALIHDALWDGVLSSLDHWTRIQRKIGRFIEGWETPQVADAVKKWAQTMGSFLAACPRLPFNQPLSGQRVLAWRSFSFTDIRTIRTVCGGTVNDVMLTIVATALHKYLQKHPDAKARRIESVRILVPVNVRQEDERGDLGNRISFVLLDIPLRDEKLVERLQSIQLQSREVKQSRLATSVSLMFDVLQSIPAPVQAALLGTLARQETQNLLSLFTAVPPANLIVTNVPGPQIPLYLVGRKMLATYPILPVCLEMGVNVAILSYDQRVFVCVVADAQAGSEYEQIAAYMEEAFNELRSAAEIKGAEYVQIVRARERDKGDDAGTTAPVTAEGTSASISSQPLEKAGTASKARRGKTQNKKNVVPAAPSSNEPAGRITKQSGTPQQEENQGKSTPNGKAVLSKKAKLTVPASKKRANGRTSQPILGDSVGSEKLSRGDSTVPGPKKKR